MNNPNTLTNVPYLDYDDYTNGVAAIKSYHNHMARLYDNYRISYDLLVQQLTSRTGGKYFIDGLGLGITLAEMSMKQVDSAMEKLAINGKGKVPSTNSSFTQALSDSSRITSFIDLPIFVATETAKDVFGAGKAIGDAVIDIGKNTIDSAKELSQNLKWFIPVVIIVGVGIATYSLTRK